MAMLRLLCVMLAAPLFVSALSAGEHRSPVSAFVGLHAVPAGLQLKGTPAHTSRAFPGTVPSARSLRAPQLQMGVGEWVKPKLHKFKQFATAAAMSALLCTVAPTRSSAASVDFDDDLDDTIEEVEIEYTGMRKLNTMENIAKYGILVGVFGSALVWSWNEGKREDKAEEDRVKAEVERIEAWKKEFIDMEDVVSDDEVMSSLNKRMSGEEVDEGVSGKDGSGGVPKDYDPEPKKTAAAMEDDDVPELDDAPAQVDAEQLERLKRMMGGGGDTPTDPKSK